MAQPTAKELGYASEIPLMANAMAGPDHDMIAVGAVVKRGDDFLTDTGWKTLPDKYINMVIFPKHRPIRRRLRWACWHLRERLDKSCPVCIVFLRHVSTPW